MKYTSAAAFRQGLEQRLRIEAEKTGVTIARLRKRVAFELFLRRLVIVAPHRWVLKGAFALDLRLDVTTRTTKDIDLGRDDTEEAAIRDMVEAQQLALDDYFTFAAIRTPAFDGADEFAAIRFHVTAELASRTFEEFIVDIGFTDSLASPPDTLRTSDLLSFAGIESIAVPAIPITQHIAEKVHAYTRQYGDPPQKSTRPKDLVDILLIAGSETIEAAELREALERTFAGRNLHALPKQLPPAPSAWSTPYAQLAAHVGIETHLAAASSQAAAFLDPVLKGKANGRWNPGAVQWDQAGEDNRGDPGVT